MRSIKRQVQILALTLGLLFGITEFQQPVLAAEHTDYSVSDITDALQNTIDWNKENFKVDTNSNLFDSSFLNNACSSPDDWIIFGYARCGISDDYPAALSVLESKVSEIYQNEKEKNALKATDYERMSLVIGAIGGDPENIIDTDGTTINLLQDGIYQFDNLGSQGLNSLIYGLLTLDSEQYAAPADAVNTRESIRTQILDAQLTDGSFNLSSELTEGEIDLTAMAVTALAPYYTQDDQVKAAVDKALEWISAQQLDTGGFNSWGQDNSESCSQVLVALTSLKLDPATDARFIKNNNTVLDGLMSFVQEDGGFIHSAQYDEENPDAKPDESNTLATAQAMYALDATARFYMNLHPLYDFTTDGADDGMYSIFTQSNMNIKNITFTDEDKAQAEALPENVTTENKTDIIRLLGKLDKASNGADYADTRKLLEDRKNTITAIEATIAEINGDIMDKLYPFEDLSSNDEAALQEIQTKYNQLSEYDKTQVLDYEELEKAEAKIHSDKTARTMKIAGSALLGALIGIFVVRIIIRRKKKNQENDSMENDQ